MSVVRMWQWVAKTVSVPVSQSVSQPKDDRPPPEWLLSGSRGFQRTWTRGECVCISMSHMGLMAYLYGSENNGNSLEPLAIKRSAVALVDGMESFCSGIENEVTQNDSLPRHGVCIYVNEWYFTFVYE